MKRHRPIRAILITAFIVCLLIIAIVAICWKPFILNFAENELRAIFKGSLVKIGSRDITPGTLVFRDIDVTTRGQQFLKTREFRINFTIISLVTDRAAEFSIKETVIYAKLKIPEVHGSVKYSKDTIALGNVSARVLSGIVEGGALIKPGKPPYYAAALKLKDIQLEKVIEVFELSEKIDLTGFISGSLELSGYESMLTRLKGKLEASPKGGTLTIKSQEWLDAIARYARTDINVVVENFKNYRYNEGNASLGLKGTSIVVDAHLSGEAGKRDLLISLHDFNQ